MNCLPQTLLNVILLLLLGSISIQCIHTKSCSSGKNNSVWEERGRIAHMMVKFLGYYPNSKKCGPISPPAEERMEYKFFARVWGNLLLDYVNLPQINISDKTMRCIGSSFIPYSKICFLSQSKSLDDLWSIASIMHQSMHYLNFLILTIEMCWQWEGLIAVSVHCSCKGWDSTQVKN